MQANQRKNILLAGGKGARLNPISPNVDILWGIGSPMLFLKDSDAKIWGLTVSKRKL